MVLARGTILDTSRLNPFLGARRGENLARFTFRHPVYLSEKEICDQIHEKYDSFFNDLGDSIVYREVEIGACRADFVEFTKNYINVIETKITADLDTVRQVTKYKRIVEEHMRSNFTEHNLNFNMNFCSTIMARNIDRDIIDLCEEMNISLYRLKFDKKKQLVDAELINEFFPPIYQSTSFLELLKKHAGLSNV